MRIDINVKDEIREVLLEVLPEVINQIKSELQIPKQNQSLKRCEAADYLNISKSQLDKLRRSGHIDGIKVGSSGIRFMKRELDRYTQDNSTSHRL